DLTSTAGMAEEQRKSASLRMKVDGSWVELSESQVFKHPGGPVITQYQDADATHMFHAFHAGSTKAYKQLATVLKMNKIGEMEAKELEAAQEKKTDESDVNISVYDISIEREKAMALSFEELRQEVIRRGWMEGAPLYFVWKIFEIVLQLTIVVWLQSHEWYISSAVVLGVAWQQLGWLAHEFCHQQPFKNRETNDILGLVLGNMAQGYSRDWWKDKHNTHHAATNIIDQDGDIDLVPLFSLIPSDLQKYKEPIEKFVRKFVPYQHLYYTLALPLLRYSWWSQSLTFAFSEQNSNYRVYRRNALGEQLGLAVHWSLVFLQLYYLPSNMMRILYFFISQSLAGLLTGHVVTYSHNSVDKYPANSRLLNNFVALQILTTRNMNPSGFIDWFWGGLNYQVEHHLFPTMPRCYLPECSKLVKKFCADNGLEYLVDDYITGYRYNLEQLERIAKIAAVKEE
ncbi:hypothetical protein PMAYCL1PPCAC_18622, partial [Pristionchus mayeri]